MYCGVHVELRAIVSARFLESLRHLATARRLLFHSYVGTSCFIQARAPTKRSRSGSSMLPESMEPRIWFQGSSHVIAGGIRTTMAPLTQEALFGRDRDSILGPI